MFVLFLLSLVWFVSVVLGLVCLASSRQQQVKNGTLDAVVCLCGAHFAFLETPTLYIPRDGFVKSKLSLSFL